MTGEPAARRRPPGHPPLGRYIVGQMVRERKRPVWGAVESNEPSLRLASKLGFRPVGRMTVLWRPA